LEPPWLSVLLEPEPEPELEPEPESVGPEPLAWSGLEFLPVLPLPVFPAQNYSVLEFYIIRSTLIIQRTGGGNLQPIRLQIRVAHFVISMVSVI